MDKIIGKGYLTANKVTIFASPFMRLFHIKRLSLSFHDSDAYPFARFLIMNIDKSLEYLFLIGKQGTTHNSLFQVANRLNRKSLGDNWASDPQNQSLTKIYSAGRIWTSKKIIVMRDPRPHPDILKYATLQIYQQGIEDIQSYRLLYDDNDNRIHECLLSDYINGSARKYGYQTTEDFHLF